MVAAGGKEFSSAEGWRERVLFPGNVIPESRISPIGKKIHAYYSTPKYPGMVNNYAVGTGGKYRYDQPMVKSEYRNSSGIPGAASASPRAPAVSKES